MSGPYEETYRLEKPQILMFLESDKGKCVLKALQEQEGCIIEVNSELSELDMPTPLNVSFLKQQITEVVDDVIVTSIGPKVLRQVVSECINKASNQGYKSIAFPALGCGNLGYPKYETAAAIVDTVREFDNDLLSLVDVHVVGLPEDLDFEEAYTRHLHKVTASEDLSSEIITIGKKSLFLLAGDITEYCSDVIVHPTTKQLSFDSGDVSLSLRLKCGPSFVEECQDEERVMKQHGVVLTGAPGLQCTKILHTTPQHFGCWKKTVKECVKYVDTMAKYKSIAFPAVPSYMQRGSLEEEHKKAAWQMVEAIMTLKTTTVNMILVFCCDQSKLDTYKDAVFRAIPDLSTKAGRMKSHMRALVRNVTKTDIPTEDEMVETSGRSVMTKLQMPEKHSSRNESIASVTVYCQENKCDAIYKKLADRCDDEYSRRVVDQRIQKLTSSQTEDLVALAKTERVVVNMEKSGEVHLEGLFHHLTKVCHHLDETLQTVADFGFVAYPTCWERVESGQRVFNVAQGSIEYMSVKNSFMATLREKERHVNISKIERIQIPDLYRQYQIAMQTVHQEHPSKDNERIIWHGTDVEAVPNINKYGFNRSYCGKNGSQYGQGVYFAVTSFVSSIDKYSPPDTHGIKYVYRARVLTGRYTMGNATMRDAPRLCRTGSVRYTSTTNDTSQPSLFCIYRDTHSYPEYLISFKLSVP
ncbi:protein mono-ADP-ribosyltransferase PARP14-like isoform X2 [Haliotis asinina]|uniref:protein mono-ADP-ribosyltransferase PARP14-like isoform X2 n=1 Tax=Haliotis asinina TaxID=109174 RepID=UPI0035323817